MEMGKWEAQAHAVVESLRAEGRMETRDSGYGHGLILAGIAADTAIATNSATPLANAARAWNLALQALTTPPVQREMRGTYGSDDEERTRFERIAQDFYRDGPA